MIFEKGFETPKSKIVSEVEMCFFKKSSVILKRLLGKDFSYIKCVSGFKFQLETEHKFTKFCLLKCLTSDFVN